MEETATVSVNTSRRKGSRPRSIANETSIGGERWRERRVTGASACGGLPLIVFGLAHGSLSGMVMGAVGGALNFRGLTGHCTVYEAMGVNNV